MQLAQSAPPQRLAVAIAAPLALLAIAYALLVVSSNLVHIGPVDRATFGWAVVIPLWLAVPGVAGLAWAPLLRRDRLLAAAALAAVVALATAISLATSITQVGCTPVTSWTDDLPLSVAVGVAFGISHSAAGLAAAAAVQEMAGAWRVVVSLLMGGVVFTIGAIVSFILFAALSPIGLSCAAPV